MNAPTSIPGYDHDDPALKPSPVTADDLGKLQASLLFGPNDQAALRTAGEVLGGQVEQILDVWYGFVGSHPHLLAYFSTP
ncbi:MAG TPA: protoglobin domain-containing protein, partial [Nonomuraea sp.]|nr:protoglobin domain-containing protein [Nonomuraea sp.]